MPKARRSAKSRYAPHPMLARERNVSKRLEESTGRPLSDWIALARKDGPPQAKACAAWLVREHGATKADAMWISSYATGKEDPADYEDPEKLVGNLYSGGRAKVRPLHEMLVDTILALGDEALVTSCKTMVPAYRKHAFAELRPVEGGVELAMSLGDLPAGGRLEKRTHATPGDRIAHRVIVRSEAEVDPELRRWLARAYELGAGRIARAPSAEVPEDIALALAASEPATATWATCTAAMQRDFVVWITSAKQQETRARRISQAVERLAAGKRRMY